MSSNPILQAVRGMNDILPEEAGLWVWFGDTVRELLGGYGFPEICIAPLYHGAFL